MKKEIAIISLVLALLLGFATIAYAATDYCGGSAYKKSNSHKYGLLLTKTCNTTDYYRYTARRDGIYWYPEYSTHLHQRNHEDCGKGSETFCTFPARPLSITDACGVDCDHSAPR